MKKTLVILLTIINYIFILFLFFINYLWKIEIGNDPLLWLIFFIYVITLIISLVIVNISKNEDKNWFYKNIKNINIFYLVWTFLLFVFLWILL